MKTIKDKNGQTLEEFLSGYDADLYERPSVSVDTAVFTLVEALGEYNLAVLLIRRGAHPYINEWALPGGFVDMNEPLSDAAARELMEETGAVGLSLRPFGVFGGVDRDPRTRVISAGFLAVAPMDSLKLIAGDDADDAGLFIVEVTLEAAGASAETYRMTLFGRRILCERARLRYDPLGAQCEFVPGGDLAADHSLILFSALRALGELPRERVARLLTLGNAPLRRKAEDALRRVLDVIPQERE